jgi:hypothetical protein
MKVVRHAWSHSPNGEAYSPDVKGVSQTDDRNGKFRGTLIPTICYNEDSIAWAGKSQMSETGGAAGPGVPQRKQEAFFCNLKALSTAERAEHQAITARLAESVLNTRELADGYAFELDGSRLSIKELAAWSDFERRCCPFFDFTLEWRRENEPVTLRLTGRDGVKEFIRAEFPKNFR